MIGNSQHGFEKGNHAEPTRLLSVMRLAQGTRREKWVVFALTLARPLTWSLIVSSYQTGEVIG